MKKYYIVGIRSGVPTPHNCISYYGFDCDEAAEAYKNEKDVFEKCLTEIERANTEIFAKCFEIPDNISESNETELLNALCNCPSYTLIFDKKGFEK